MPQPRRALLPAALWATLLLSTASAAPAATVTADQAQAIEHELQDWLQTMLGRAVASPDRPVQLIPEGGDYALLIPLSTDTAITGHLTPQDDGRWLLSDVKLPSPASFTLDVPVPAEEGQSTAARSYQFSVVRQHITGTFDPSYKTASSLQNRFEDLQVTSSGGGLQQTSQVAHAAGQSTLTPAADGRFDLASETNFDGYLMSTRREDGDLAVHVTADRGRIASQISGVSPDRGPAFLRDAIGFVAQLLPAMSRNAPPQLTAEQRAQLRGVVDALDSFASGLQMDDALEGVQVQAGSVAGIARRAHLSFGGEAPNSLLRIYLDLGVEGLSLPGLPVGPYADLVPTDAHLRPTLSGVATKDLLDLARAALDEAGQGSRPSFAPLFAHGGVVAGLDDVSFNVGPANFAGRGAMTFAAPGAFTGEGQVTATDLDALMDRVKQDPAMRSVFPVLTVAKGIGRAEGDRTVWDITYQDGKTLVNGVDVMAMAGAGSGGASARPPARTVPSPSPGPQTPGSRSVKPPPK